MCSTIHLIFNPGLRDYQGKKKKKGSETGSRYRVSCSSLKYSDPADPEVLEIFVIVRNAYYNTFQAQVVEL